MAPVVVRSDAQPARAARRVDRAGVGRPLHALDARHRARREEREQRVVGQRRPERRAQDDPLPVSLGQASRPAPPQLRRRRAEGLAHGRVEAAQAREACRVGDLGHRQRRLLEELAREVRAPRPRDGLRRRAQVLLEEAAQVAARHAEALGERVDPRGVERAVRDEAQPPGDRDRRADGHRRGGRRVRAAPQARPQTLLLRGRGGRVEADVLAARRGRGATRATVDARRVHADDEVPLEAPVAAEHRVEHAVIVERHEDDEFYRRGPRARFLAVFGRGPRMARRFSPPAAQARRARDTRTSRSRSPHRGRAHARERGAHDVPDARDERGRHGRVELLVRLARLHARRPLVRVARDDEVHERRPRQARRASAHALARRLERGAERAHHRARLDLLAAHVVVADDDDAARSSCHLVEVPRQRARGQVLRGSGRRARDAAGASFAEGAWTTAPADAHAAHAIATSTGRRDGRRTCGPLSLSQAHRSVLRPAHFSPRLRFCCAPRTARWHA